MIFAVLTLAVIAAALAFAYWQKRAETDPLRPHRRVLVMTKSGHAVGGLLTQVRGRVIEVRAAAVHMEGRAPTAVDGSFVLDRAEVLWVQAFDGGDA